MGPSLSHLNRKLYFFCSLSEDALAWCSVKSFTQGKGERDGILTQAGRVRITLLSLSYLS